MKYVPDDVFQSCHIFHIDFQKTRQKFSRISCNTNSLVKVFISMWMWIFSDGAYLSKAKELLDLEVDQMPGQQFKAARRILITELLASLNGRFDLGESIIRATKIADFKMWPLAEDEADVLGFSLDISKYVLSSATIACYLVMLQLASADLSNLPKLYSKFLVCSDVYFVHCFIIVCFLPVTFTFCGFEYASCLFFIIFTVESFPTRRRPSISLNSSQLKYNKEQGGKKGQRTEIPQINLRTIKDKRDFHL